MGSEVQVNDSISVSCAVDSPVAAVVTTVCFAVRTLPSVGTWLIPYRDQVLWSPPFFLDFVDCVALVPAPGTFDDPSLFHLLPSVGTWHFPHQRHAHLLHDTLADTDGKSRNDRCILAQTPNKTSPTASEDPKWASYDKLQFQSCTNDEAALVHSIPNEKLQQNIPSDYSCSPIAKLADSSPVDKLQTEIPTDLSRSRIAEQADSSPVDKLQQNITTDFSYSRVAVAATPKSERHPGVPPTFAVETPVRADSGHGQHIHMVESPITLPGSPDGDGDSSAEGRIPLLSAEDGNSARKIPYKPQLRPVERRRVGCDRRKVRDEWNIHELRMLSAMSSHDLHIARGIGEEELESLLFDVTEETPEQPDVFRTMRLANRGKSKCVNMEQLHYALRSQQARQALPQGVLRMLAEADFGPRHAPDPKRIHAFLEKLNEGHPVLMAEADMVLYDASLMAPDGQPPGRAELLPSIVAWYLHVERKKTPRWTLLRLWLSRWTPKKAYHSALLDHLNSATLSPTERRRAAANIYDGADYASMRERVFRCARKGVTTCALVAALAMPTLFYLVLVFVGATRGDARCPQDLDGLFIWFGIIGLASVAVECTGSRKEFSSSIGFALKSVLLALPWMGVFWTFHISQDDMSRCGSLMPWASGTVWFFLVIAEMFILCFFFWELSVLSENEQTLQRTLGVSEEP